MKSLLVIFTFITLNVFGQNAEMISDKAVLVRGRHFRGVIFPANYALPVFDDRDKERSYMSH